MKRRFGVGDDAHRWLPYDNLAWSILDGVEFDQTDSSFGSRDHRVSIMTTLWDNDMLEIATDRPGPAKYRLRLDVTRDQALALLQLVLGF